MVLAQGRHMPSPRRSLRFAFLTLLAVGCTPADHLMSEAERLEAREPEVAARLYDEACTAGYRSACLALGMLVGERAGHDAQAIQALQRGCSLGLGLACFFAGEWGPGAEMTRSLFRRGCRLGHGPSCARSGAHERALELLLPRCGEARDPAACHYAGISARALGRRELARRLQRVGCTARIPAACSEVRALETLLP